MCIRDRYDRIEMNYPKIFETPFLEAFKVTRAGGDHPLFNQMLMGMNIPGAGVVNGSTITGSSALRKYTSTRTFLANGNVFGLADFLEKSTCLLYTSPSPRDRQKSR